MVFLSFNPLVTKPEDIAGSDDEAVQEEESNLPLRDTWVIWTQLAPGGSSGSSYSNHTKQLHSCSTVEEFWSVWSRLPQPSELLNKRLTFKTDDFGDARNVDALMVFRDGVQPQWEDAANAEGGHFQFQLKAAMGAGQIDEYWNNLILGVIGGCLEPYDMITGVRLVDKLTVSRSNHQNVHGSIRVEVWFDSIKDPKACAALQENVENCMATRTLEGNAGVAPKGETKVHKLTRHQ
eukprot:TRINITY_DN65121_c0_g1_i1.p1 TRINITY_DN65121_c0_g1~~TRINITY_DN65121_c0_g1_i1.p1  ORF type:complete len:236 (+),score=32.29 TRINITY_DN65121_c0_g1_i1:78-785(+)